MIQSPFMIDGVLPSLLGKATTEESNDMLRICDCWNLQPQQLDSNHTNNVLEFEKWMELLRERAMTYRNWASVEAVTSILNIANAYRNQNENSTSVSKKIEAECARDHDRTSMDELAMPSANIPESDWSSLDSDDDSECFFSFSPGGHNDLNNGKPVSTPPQHNTNIPVKALRGCLTLNKGIQAGYTVVESSNVSLEMTNKTREYWSDKFKPGVQVKGYRGEIELAAIPEESQE